jgi:septal ring factor EnvC (AmiA/AmiB activator)
MEPTSRQDLNPSEEFQNVRDRETEVYEQIKAGRSKLVDLFLGRINEVKEDLERKEQLISALNDRNKELENELREKDGDIATLTLELELARSERDSVIQQIQELGEKDCYSDKTEVRSSQCDRVKNLVAVTVAVGAVVAAGWWFFHKNCS